MMKKTVLIALAAMSAFCVNVAFAEEKTEVKTADTKKTEVKTADTKKTEVKTADTKKTEVKTADTKKTEVKTADTKKEEEVVIQYSATGSMPITAWGEVFFRLSRLPEKFSARLG